LQKQWAPDEEALRYEATMTGRRLSDERAVGRGFKTSLSSRRKPWERRV